MSETLYDDLVAANAKMLVNLYNGDRQAAMIEVFNQAKSFAGKQNDKPNDYWRDVFLAIQKREF